MVKEVLDVPEYHEPAWLQNYDSQTQQGFREARQADIEDYTSQTRGIIEAYLPDMAESHPAEIEALAVRWATGLRNHFEAGMGIGFEEVREQMGRAAAESFMRNFIEAVPGS